VPGQASRGTRERLIEAAAELMAERGYDRVGVQAIARRAGLTNGAIYANFRDKAHLLAEAMEVRLPRLFEAIEQGRQAGKAPIDLLALIARSIGTVTPDPDRRLLVEAWSAAWRDPAVGALVRERLGRVESAVAGLAEQAKADGDLAEDVDPATLARFGCALALGYHLIHTAGVPDPDRAQWQRLMERVLASARRGGG
jgi:AcrR family transcriptional regulator